MREEKWAKNCRVKNLMVNLLSRSEKVLGFSRMRRGLSLCCPQPVPLLSTQRHRQPSLVCQV